MSNSFSPHRTEEKMKKGGISSSGPHIKVNSDMMPSIVSRHQSGDLEGALVEYDLLLQHEPDHAEALHLSGVVLHQQGDHRAAIKRIERAIQLRPNALLFRKNLASCYRSAGEFDRALELCQECLRQDSQDATVQMLYGRTLEDLKQFQAALDEYAKCNEQQLTTDQRFELLIRKGDCLSVLERHTQAIDCITQAGEIRKKDLVVEHNLGREYQLLKDLERAEEHYIRALEINQTCASAWNNLGVIYQDRAEYRKSFNCINRAVELCPSLADAVNNLANLHEAMGNFEPMRGLYERAISLRPDYPEAHHSLSQVMLRGEEFARGWELYRWRYKKKDHDHRPYRHQEWQGESLKGKKLLVYSEQGIGDVVMFATCLPDLLKEVPQLSLEVDPRMTKLFARSFPGVTTVDRPHRDPAPPLFVKGADVQISIADLLERYRQKVEDFPRAEQLLEADPVLRMKWRKRLDQLGPGLKVGISWTGGKNLDLKTRRSLPLEQWAAWGQIPGVKFINLQYGDHRQTLTSFEQFSQVRVYDWADSDPMKDLEDFSAKISELDLVISIDNATVHFAGALGVPTWCLLCKVPDWRWFFREHETLWYKSVQLFRQQEPADWSTVLSAVQSELKELSQAHANSSGVVSSVDSFVKLSGRGLGSRSKQTPTSSAPKVIATKPQCAIITPVGPGHAEIYQQAEESIRQACMNSSGPFSKVTPFRIDDLAGQIGRSRARNFAVQQAAKQGIEWVFFLDADDVLVPKAFANVEAYLEQYDAIWGQIFCFDEGSNRAVQRENQLGKTNRFEDILKSDPFYSLQMGHFVRTSVALENPFNEQLDVGEDFDYYLRVWEKYRCIKIEEAFFANRRGRHSTGPRSGTGRDWTIRVNEMLNRYRQKRLAPQRSTEPEKARIIPKTTAIAPMKLAIYGMMRSGTTLLCDQLSVPGRGLVLLEPNMHLDGWPNQLLTQLQQFGIPLEEQEWKSTAARGVPFADYFQSRILPELEKLEYWGVKMVNFSHWRDFLTRYPAEHLILCVRDLRDVILSALDLAPRLENFVDAQWIAKRAKETAQAIVAMSERPHTLVRYEDFCTQPELIEGLAVQLGIPQATDHRLSLEAVPHRKYENEKHGGRVSTKSIHRFEQEPAGQRRDLAEKIWQECAAYNERFGYTQTQSKPALPSAAEQLTSYWQQDHLANIIPLNQKLGEFPEGWDVRPFLWEMLKGDVRRNVLEVGCGYGRLCQSFPTDYYLGVDINPEAVQAARTRHPGYDFLVTDFTAPYPKSDAILLYTVLLHIDDQSLPAMLERLAESSNVILIAEILGKARWRRSGNPPVFNRDLEDYQQLMQKLGYVLERVEHQPYQHYPNTNISFLKFSRLEK
ncbi:MAG: tetratricopeptide repeat protein [Planctomycetaceae bacterium]|nr:tetratricopeptide repeat protein [Planctomycetaceae bacterium]